MNEANFTKWTRYKPLFLGGVGLTAVILLSVLSLHGLFRRPSEASIVPAEAAQGRRIPDSGAAELNATVAKELETETGSQPSHRLAPVEEDIELPDPEVNQRKTNLALTQLSNEQYWKEEDTVAGSWPKLDALREQLVKELHRRFDVEEMAAEEFVQNAVDLRERFWQSGGRMSADSFTDIYLARVLLEFGRQRHPEDLTLTDELVETIQSAWPHLTYNSTPPRGLVPLGRDGKPLEPGSYMGFDSTTMNDLLELREKQFELMQRQFTEGRRPEFQDFLRLYDLSVLYRYTPSAEREANRVQAGRIVRWLLDHADQGNWAYYRTDLERLNNRWAGGGGYAFSIFVSGSQKGEHSGQYARRLPSFRGPQSRDLIAFKDVPPGSAVRRGTIRTNAHGSAEIVGSR